MVIEKLQGNSSETSSGPAQAGKLPRTRPHCPCAIKDKSLLITNNLTLSLPLRRHVTSACELLLPYKLAKESKRLPPYLRCFDFQLPPLLPPPTQHSIPQLLLVNSKVRRHRMPLVFSPSDLHVPLQYSGQLEAAAQSSCTSDTSTISSTPSSINN